MSKYGFVYLLKNLDEIGIYKLGCTKRPPHSRLDEINSSNPDVRGFMMVCYAEVVGCHTVEGQIFKHLKKYRIPSTELLKCDLETIVSYILYHDSVHSFCDIDVQPALCKHLYTIKNPYTE